MNRFTAVAALTLLVGASSLAWAAAPVAGNPAIHNVNFRLRQDMMQIQKDTRSGKLSKAQATALRAKVKAVRKQELAFLKTNGTKQLTASQETQLEQSLTPIEAQI